MNAAIKTLANTKANKKIAVLGDMLELGDYSKKLIMKSVKPWQIIKLIFFWLMAMMQNIL